jgi:DNA (cytosine-5)-methyltransferase 1
MDVSLVFGSVCSGIEAASCAWHPLGWHAAFVSEIEPFPCAVLAHHYPDVPNLGDMTKFKDWPYAAIDLLVGGTPCQSFSVAGLRKGLADPRGNLLLTYLAIAERYAPRWLVWENVPGILSSNGGRDFGTLLGGLAELGYGFAYRVLDAQYVRTQSHARAVPQRRRRVFVVGYLGDWRRAAAVLFERESLLGHPAPRREARESVAPTLSARTKGGGGLGTDFDCDGGLVAHSLRAEGFDASEDGTGRGTPLIPVPFDTTQITSKSNFSNPRAGDPCHPLAAGAHAPAIAFQNSQSGMRLVESHATLDANNGSRRHNGVLQGSAVRRLMPLECERLQGFPDSYTAIPFNGKPAKDGPRYKALGNSMAVNVMRWLGTRIELVESLLQTTEEAS